MEIAGVTSKIAVRDSKNPNGPKLTISPAAWTAFTHEVKGSVHDLP